MVRVASHRVLWVQRPESSLCVDANPGGTQAWPLGEVGTLQEAEVATGVSIPLFTVARVSHRFLLWCLQAGEVRVGWTAPAGFWLWLSSGIQPTS